jgi:CheY-like chemotaxis protein
MKCTMKAITLLDDTPDYLEEMIPALESRGVLVLGTTLIEEAISNLVSGISDGLLTDYCLDDFDPDINGVNVIKKIRITQPHKFYVIITACEEEISDDDRRYCKENGILIVSKYDDDDQSATNIAEWYFSTGKDSQTTKESSGFNFNPEITRMKEESLINELRPKVLKHLDGISNQQAIIHWDQNNSLSITDLKNHVSKLSKIGKEYISGWYKARLFLDEGFSL